MEYLKKKYKGYIKLRKQGKTYEDYSASTSQGFIGMFKKIKNFLPKKSKVLEVGFGSGYMLSLMAKEGWEVHGIDNNPFSLKFAKTLFRDKKVKGKLSLADGFKIPYQNNSFDLVFNSGVLEHFTYKKQEEMLKEMLRVSKKYILIAVPNDNPKSFFASYRKTSNFIDEGEDYMPDLKKLAKKFNLKILLLSGSHIIGDYEKTPKEMLEFYKKQRLNLPWKKYSKKDIPKLVKIELGLGDKTLYRRAFTKYILCEKQ